MKNSIISSIMRFNIFLSIVGLLSSCQKEETFQETIAIAKVTVINAVVGGGNAKANVSNREIYWSTVSETQSFGGYAIGRIFIAPTDDHTILKVVPSADTTKYWFNEKRNLKAGERYTLYLSGTIDDVDTLFSVEPHFPKMIIRDPSKFIPITDSVVNLRFVNLSSSGPRVDINIAGREINEVTNLGYKEFTDFKAYRATAEVGVITVEIRNSETKEVVATYQVDVSKWGNLFKSIAVVIAGVYDPNRSLPIPDVDRYAAKLVIYQ